MNGYRTEPRRRFPSQNRHPVDVFSGYDDTEFHQPQSNHQQQQSSNNTFAPIRESPSSTQGPGIFYSEYRSGRSSVPAHLLNSTNSDPIFNRTHPSPTTASQQKIPFIDTAEFDYPLTPKQILDTFQRQHQQQQHPSSDNNTWFNNKQSNPSNWAQKIGGEQVFDDNWSPALKPQFNQLQQQQQDINNPQQTSSSTKVPWRQNNFQSISDNNTSSSLSNRLIDDLLAPYSLETSSQRYQQQQQGPIQHNNQQQQQQLRSIINFRNPQPYYPYRRPSSALADPFVHSNSTSSTTTTTVGPTTNGVQKKVVVTTVDPLRQQNRERIQPLHFRNPLNSDPEQQPRPTHRTFSEPNSQAAHTLDILSTSLYDPNSSYYSSNRQSQPQQTQQQQQRHSDYLLNNNINNIQKSHFSDTDDFFNTTDDEMSKTTANWKNSFAAMRDRFGSKEKTPDETNDLPFGFDHSYASNGSLTMPRSRGLLKSASHSTIGKVEPSRSSSLLREAVINRRASEAPDFMQNGSSATFGRRSSSSSETPEPTAKRPLGNFWIETVKNRPTSPSIPRLPYKMTTAAERLEQLHEPIDNGSNGIDRNNSQDSYYTPESNGGSYGSNVFRKAAPESVVQRRNQFVESYSTAPKNNGFPDSSTPFPSERYVSERKTNGHPNFSSLDNAVADLKQNAEKLFNDSRGCARFPIGEFNNPPSTTKRLGIFTGTRISPPRYIPTSSATLNGQHSPSPDSLSGESNTSIANLPHPRPKHNIREQLMNAGISSNTHFGPYMGRRSVTPNFPAPTSGSVASRISVFEKRPGTPTLLQLASASTSAENLPEPPRSPLSPRTTVYRTKPVIHMEMNENNGTIRGGAISPEYDNKHIATVSTSAAFHFPHKVCFINFQHCFNINLLIKFFCLL